MERLICQGNGCPLRTICKTNDMSKFGKFFSVIPYNFDKGYCLYWEWNGQEPRTIRVRK